MLGISDAVELTKKVGDLVKAGVTLGLQEKIVELREAVINAKDEMLRLREENQSQADRLLEKTAWADKASRYTLVESPGGALVYETVEPPAHYACPRCFEMQKRSILQNLNVLSGEFRCIECAQDFMVSVARQRPVGAVEYGGGSSESWMAR